MAAITFTAVVLNQIKVEKGREEFIDDKPLGVPGSLGLRVSANGEKKWFIRYRLPRKPNPQRYTFPVGYPAFGLAEARTEARRLLIDIQQGINPSAERRVEHEAITFLELCEIYLTLHAERLKKPKSIHEDRLMINGAHLRPWRDRKAKDISRKDVVDLIDRIAASAPVYASRYRALISKIFNFAIERVVDNIEHNPVHKVPNPDPKTRRDRVLRDQEIQIYWKAFNQHHLGNLFKILLLTGQRSQEVARMKWQDISLQDREWVIPSSDVKNKTEHLVPLSQPVIDLLLTLSPHQDGYVFLSRRKSDKPHTHVESRDRVNLKNLTGINDITPHDFRRTVKTNLGKLGISRFVQDRVTNHVDKTVSAIYDRYDYLKEKQQALDCWAEYLLKIVEQGPS